MIDDALRALERQAAENPDDLHVRVKLDLARLRAGIDPYPLPDCSTLQFHRRRQREIGIFQGGAWDAMERARIVVLVAGNGARRKKTRDQRRRQAQRAATYERGMVTLLTIHTHDAYAAASPSVAPLWGDAETPPPAHRWGQRPPEALVIPISPNAIEERIVRQYYDRPG